MEETLDMILAILALMFLLQCGGLFCIVWAIQRVEDLLKRMGE